MVFLVYKRILPDSFLPPVCVRVRVCPCAGDAPQPDGEPDNAAGVVLCLQQGGVPGAQARLPAGRWQAPPLAAERYYYSGKDPPPPPSALCATTTTTVN